MVCNPHMVLIYMYKLQANEVYVLSGRDRKTLGNWFSGLKIGLSAEYPCQFIAVVIR